MLGVFCHANYTGELFVFFTMTDINVNPGQEVVQLSTNTLHIIIKS